MIRAETRKFSIGGLRKKTMGSKCWKSYKIIYHVGCFPKFWGGAWRWISIINFPYQEVLIWRIQVIFFFLVPARSSILCFYLLYLPVPFVMFDNQTIKEKIFSFHKVVKNPYLKILNPKDLGLVRSSFYWFLRSNTLSPQPCGNPQLKEGKYKILKYAQSSPATKHDLRDS